MLLELIILGLVGYLLLVWHRKDIARGGEGLGSVGPILEELEGVVLKIIDIFKKKTTQKKSVLTRIVATNENSTLKASPKIDMIEKFESVRQPREQNRPKHHSKHRSKMDSAIKAAQQ